MTEKCNILIQIKKENEDTSIKDYYKYEKTLTTDIIYDKEYSFRCEQVGTLSKKIQVFKDGKVFDAFYLNGSAPQPYQKGVVYNEVELTDEMKKQLNIDSSLASWIYIECYQ